MIIFYLTIIVFYHKHTRRCPYTVSGEHEPNVILKDNDIKYKIRLPRSTTENLLTQIRADAEFLHSIGVMDYSLLGMELNVFNMLDMMCGRPTCFHRCFTFSF